MSKNGQYDESCLFILRSRNSNIVVHGISFQRRFRAQKGDIVLVHYLGKFAGDKGIRYKRAVQEEELLASEEGFGQSYKTTC